MIVYNRYTAEKAGTVRETGYPQIRRFLDQESQATGLDSLDTIRNLEKLLNSKFDEFASSLSIETGNTFSDCRGEVQASIYACQNAVSGVESGRIFSGELKRGKLFAAPVTQESVIRTGSALCITSSYSPLYRFVETVIAALLSGSRSVIRPSSTGISAIMTLWEGLNDSRPETIIPVALTSSSSVLKRLVHSEQIENLVFRGSRDTFSILQKTALNKKLTGFIGGTSYAMVLSDADLDEAALAISRIVLSGLRDPGFTPHRVLVMQENAQYLSNRIVEESLKFRHGNPSDASTDISSLPTMEHVNLFIDAVTDEKKNWAEPLTEPLIDNNSVSPAVLRVSEKPGMLWSELNYGPFIAIRAVNSVEEAFSLLGYDRFAASLYIFTSDLNMQKYVSSNSRAEYIIENPPPTISRSDFFRIENSLERTLSALQNRRINAYWE